MTLRNQAIFWAGVAAFIFAMLWLLSDILLPFVAGMAIAYFLDPIADRLERAGMSRTLATSIILGLFFLLAVLGLLILIPVLANQAHNLIVALPGLIEQARELMLPYLRRFLPNLVDGGWSDLRDAFGGTAEKAFGFAADVARRLVGGGLAVLNLLSLAVITPVVAFYLLRDWDRMVGTVDGWLPRQHAEVIREQVRLIDETLAGFVRGQGTVCMAMGLFYAVGLTLIGLDFGLVIGLVSGLVSFIPYVGAIFGFGASLTVAVIQFWPDYVWIGATAAIFVVGQFLEGNFVSPKLVGERVGLHPVWLMFSLLAFGALFGFVGVLIAVPVAAVIGVLTRFAIGRYLNSRVYSGPPGPPPTASP